MSVETLQTVAMIFFVASGILFAAAVFLFFVFNIPGIIGDLSGITARRAIEDIKEKSKTENSQSHLSYSKLMRGRLTEKVAGSTSLNRLTGSLRHGKSTRKLPKRFEKTAPLPVKASNETVQLAPGASKETTVLSGNLAPETTVLTINEQPVFQVDIDLMLYESSETID